MEITEGAVQPDTDVPKDGLIWAKSEKMGELNEVLQQVSNRSVLAYSRCKSYASLSNKQKLTCNQMGKASVAYVKCFVHAHRVYVRITRNFQRRNFSGRAWIF